jgi:hypothetical protein
MTINKQLRHMSNRRLFIDNYFELTDQRNNTVKDEQIVWLRPRVCTTISIGLVKKYIFVVGIKGSCREASNWYQYNKL